MPPPITQVRLVDVQATRTSSSSGPDQAFRVTVTCRVRGRRARFVLTLHPRLPSVASPGALYALALAAWWRNEEDATFVRDVLGA